MTRCRKILVVRSMLRRCSVVRVEQNRFEETWNADGSDTDGRAFAEAMGLRPETVSGWENGERGIGGSIEQLSRHNICALLHKDTPAIIYDPADITRMRILNAPEDFALPPLAFRRVVVKDRWEVAEAWDRLPLAA